MKTASSASSASPASQQWHSSPSRPTWLHWWWMVPTSPPRRTSMWHHPCCSRSFNSLRSRTTSTCVAQTSACEDTRVQEGSCATARPVTHEIRPPRYFRGTGPSSPNLRFKAHASSQTRPTQLFLPPSLPFLAKAPSPINVYKGANCTK